MASSTVTESCLENTISHSTEQMVFDSSYEEEQATAHAKRLDDGDEDKQPSNSDEQPAQPASEIQGLKECQCSGGTR